MGGEISRGRNRDMMAAYLVVHEAQVMKVTSKEVGQHLKLRRRINAKFNSQAKMNHRQ